MNIQTTRFKIISAPDGTKKLAEVKTTPEAIRRLVRMRTMRFMKEQAGNLPRH